ncbi:MAG: hypothetical protein ACI9G1_000711, partial [Pirellulaceae bacterium]
CVKPCQTFTWQARRVPYTTYQPVVSTTPIYSGNNCSTCQSSPYQTGRPAGCSTCGVNRGYASAGYANQSYGTSPNGQPNYGQPNYGTQNYGQPTYGTSNYGTGGAASSSVAPIPQQPADGAPVLRHDEVEGTSLLQKPATPAPIEATRAIPNLNAPENEATHVQPQGNIKPVIDLDAQQEAMEIRAPRLLDPQDRQAVHLLPSAGSTTPAIWKTARSPRYQVAPASAIGQLETQAKPRSKSSSVYAGGWRASK